MTHSPVLLSFVHSFIGQPEPIKASSASAPTMDFKNAEMNKSTFHFEGAEAKGQAVRVGETQKFSSPDPGIGEGLPELSFRGILKDPGEEWRRKLGENSRRLQHCKVILGGW